MTLWLILPVAIISVTLCLYMWFRDVRRIMRARESTVESAAGQLAAYRERASKAPNNPDVLAVLERNKKIYEQAVVIYNRTLSKPLNYLPARLMGYHHIS